MLRAAGCLGVLGLLSACAGGPQMSASQEAADYSQRARHSYNAPGTRSDPWGPYIHEASERFDVPERWVREVMRVESGGRTEMGGRPITSGAGAMGLMQVMPATYDELRSRHALGDDPYDPHNNILAGTAYIRELYDLYGSPGFLAAYNGGPGRLDDYLTRNRALPEETRRYVAKIGPYIADSFPNKRSTAEVYAMNSLPASIPAGPRYPVQAPVSAPVAAPPVEVAYAPPAANDGAFDPPPGWKPTGMSRSEVAAYVPPPTVAPAQAPAPVAVAAAEPSRFEPAPIPYTDMLAPEQTPRQTASLIAPAPRSQPLPVPPSSPPSRGTTSGSQYASLPEPPRYVPTVQTASAYGTTQLASRSGGFHLIAPATAAPVPPYRGGAGDWAIQVGAFGNEGLARIAVGNARDQAGPALASARPAVTGVREPHGTLYRARLTGLSRDAAAQACDRLRGRSNCIVLSPDAQS